MATADASSPAPQKKPAPSTVSSFVMGPGLDDLGISVQGVKNPASVALDGPVTGSEVVEAADPTTYPLSAQRRAEQKARAMKLGLTPGDDTLPDDQSVPQRHARAFDASEGTSLDPLRDKTYDLNYAKTVPPLK